MSYILEALKKSDKKRQEEESSSVLHKVHAELPAFKRRRSRRVLLLGLTFLLIVFFTGFLFFLLSERDQPAPIAQTPLIEKGLKSSTEEASTNESELDVPELRPARSKVPVINTTSPATEVIEPQPILTSPVSPPSPPAEEEQRIAKTPFLEELPQEFQETVPELKLAGHVYSIKPKLRLIMINNKIVREGEVVENDLILDEITPDGIILRKDLEHFRLTAY